MSHYMIVADLDLTSDNAKDIETAVTKVLSECELVRTVNYVEVEKMEVGRYDH